MYTLINQDSLIKLDTFVDNSIDFEKYKKIAFLQIEKHYFKLFCKISNDIQIKQNQIQDHNTCCDNKYHAVA